MLKHWKKSVALITFSVLVFSFTSDAQVPSAQGIADAYRDVVTKAETAFVSGQMHITFDPCVNYTQQHTENTSVRTWDGDKWRFEILDRKGHSFFDGTYYYTPLAPDRYLKQRVDNINYARSTFNIRFFSLLRNYGDYVSSAKEVTITHVEVDSTDEIPKLLILLPACGRHAKIRLLVHAEPPYLPLSYTAWDDEVPENKFTYNFADFQVLDNGIAMPFRIESTCRADRTKMDADIITKFEYNIELSDAIFQPPPGAKIEREDDRALEEAGYLYRAVTDILSF